MTDLEQKINTIWNEKQTKLLPENIKKGVNVLGIEGTLETGGAEINNQDKEITENGEYIADEGYTGLGTVTVNVPEENKLSPIDYNAALQLCDDIKGNPPPKEGHIYGVRKLLDSNLLERTDEARGLTAEATHDGHPESVTNDFDTLEPWVSIKSFMYDSQKEEIIAWYGDDNFTFKPSESYINIFTRIPRFWYKRYKDEEYEYWKIADYAAEGFMEFGGCSPARYTISGSMDVPRSVSGGTLVNGISEDIGRTKSKQLGSYNGLLDIWAVGAIQMLYLVEYANADSQLMLGKGIFSTTSSNRVTGGCDSLGMKSGCIKDDNSNPVIYRGFENIFGNYPELVDGINIVEYQAWICGDWTKYHSTNTEDYKQLSYINASSPASNTYFGKELGLDETYPLVMLPISVSSEDASFGKDGYMAKSGNMCMKFGGGWVSRYTSQMGLFCVHCDDTASSGISTGSARFLLHKIS